MSVPPSLLIKAPNLPRLPEGRAVTQAEATAVFITWAQQYHQLANQCDALIDAVNILHPSP